MHKPNVVLNRAWVDGSEVFVHTRSCISQVVATCARMRPTSWALVRWLNPVWLPHSVCSGPCSTFLSICDRKGGQSQCFGTLTSTCLLILCTDASRRHPAPRECTRVECCAMGWACVYYRRARIPMVRMSVRQAHEARSVTDNRGHTQD